MASSDVLFELPEGVEMSLDPEDALSRQLIGGSFEFGERAFVTRFLRPGDVFFDIGANIGVFTLVASAAVSSTGVVHSFEPCSRSFCRLKRNVELNNFDNVVLNRLALSDSSGDALLNIAKPDHDAWNSLAPLWDGVAVDPAASPPEQVQTQTLDEYLERIGYPSINLVKLDVEGWEAQVLSGGLSVFSSASAPTCIVEFTDVIAAAASSSTFELYQYIERLGFELYRYDATSNDIVAEPYRGSYPYDNLICTKSADSVRERLLAR